MAARHVIDARQEEQTAGEVAVLFKILGRPDLGERVLADARRPPGEVIRGDLRRGLLRDMPWRGLRGLITRDEIALLLASSEPAVRLFAIRHPKLAR